MRRCYSNHIPDGTSPKLCDQPWKIMSIAAAIEQPHVTQFED